MLFTAILTVLMGPGGGGTATELVLRNVGYGVCANADAGQSHCASEPRLWARSPPGKISLGFKTVEVLVFPQVSVAYMGICVLIGIPSDVSDLSRSSTICYTVIGISVVVNSTII